MGACMRVGESMCEGEYAERSYTSEPVVVSYGETCMLAISIPGAVTL